MAHALPEFKVWPH